MRRRLTSREREACELLLQAKRNPEIARAMGISEETVKHRFSQIARIMGYGSMERVRLAVLIHEQRKGLGIRCQACGETGVMAAVRH